MPAVKAETTTKELDSHAQADATPIALRPDSHAKSNGATSIACVQTRKARERIPSARSETSPKRSRPSALSA